MSGRTILDAVRDLLYRRVNDHNREQRKKRVCPPCPRPECGSNCVVKVPPGFRCNQCGEMFYRCPKCAQGQVTIRGLTLSCACGHSWSTALTTPTTRAKWLQDNPDKQKHGL